MVLFGAHRKENRGSGFMEEWSKALLMLLYCEIWLIRVESLLKRCISQEKRVCIWLKHFLCPMET